MDCKTKHRIKRLLEKDPKNLYNIVENMIAEFGKEVENFFDCHIRDKDFYNEAVSCFCNFDGTKGAHWTIEAIEKNTSIDFDKQEYTLLDYAYVVNMKYSDDGDLMSSESIFKSSKRYLDDKDYYGDPSERAYHDAMRRTEYFLDDEDEE